MKTLRAAIATAILICASATLSAQEAAPEPVPEEAIFSEEQLDELLGPIALYPDVLVAIILPAAASPADVVLAARYVESDGDPDAIEEQPWDDSVKSLARYPDVLAWMNENLDWTMQVGQAFLVQPVAVMQSAQRLRSAAIAAGNLESSPEQKVVVEREVVRIVPTNPEVIYVPVYDPVVVYRPVNRVVYSRPVISYGLAYHVGPWLCYDFDWHLSSVVVIGRSHRHTVWYDYPDWRYRPVSRSTIVHVWKPSHHHRYDRGRSYHRRYDHPARPDRIRVEGRPGGRRFNERFVYSPDRDNSRERYDRERSDRSRDRVTRRDDERGGEDRRRDWQARRNQAERSQRASSPPSMRERERPAVQTSSQARVTNRSGAPQRPDVRTERQAPPRVAAPNRSEQRRESVANSNTVDRSRERPAAPSTFNRPPSTRTNAPVAAPARPVAAQTRPAYAPPRAPSAPSQRPSPSISQPRPAAPQRSVAAPQRTETPRAQVAPPQARPQPSARPAPQARPERATPPVSRSSSQEVRANGGRR